MNKIFTHFFSRKVYLLLVLGWLGMSTTSCTYQYYTPSATTSFTGTNTFCQGATATANTLHYSECTTGLGIISSGVSCNVQWYYNTTGGTSITTSTPLGTSAGFTSAAGGGGTLSYIPLTTAAGTFYYFAYITWGTGYCTSPYVSGTETITVNPLPGPITGTGTICAGDTDPLIESSSGGTWSSSMPAVATVSTGGVVTGISVGTSVISYATSCSPAATFTVTVLQPAAAIGGPSVVCAGSAITLTNTTPGGTWTSSAPSYATVASGTGIVTGIAPGSTVINYSTGCGAGASKTITINPLPAAITGIDSVCDNGATTTLSDATSGGTWSTSTTTIASVSPSSGIVTGITAGVASVTYTSLLNCTAVFTMSVDASPAPITGTPTECAGQTTTLSESVPGGVWSTGDNSIATVDASGTVTGITAGTASISYTNHCASAVISNVVKQLPGPISGPDSVCSLSSITLSDIANGGTWSSSNAAVASILPLTIASASLTGEIAGTTTVSYTMASGCSVSGTFTIVPNPLPISGPSIGCPGETITLVDASGIGVWSSDNSYVAVIDPISGVLTGVSPDDTVTISYTIPNGCSASSLIFISTLPAPISGLTATCAGLPDTLTDDSLGGIWTAANTSVATIDASSGVLTTLSSGSTAITYTIPSSGCYVTGSALVHPLPIPVIIFYGADNTFTVSDTDYVSFQWYSGPGMAALTPIPGAVSYNLAALYNEYYTVKVTDSFGCTSEAVVYDMTALNTNNLQVVNTASIHPNPATSELNITSSVPVNAIISDMSGKTVIEQKNAIQIDISRLASGVYMGTLYDEDGRQMLVEKLIKN